MGDCHGLHCKPRNDGKNIGYFPGRDFSKFTLAFLEKLLYTVLVIAGVMELVDVVDSKSTASDGVPVRVRSPAPNQYNPNQIFPVGNGFGLFVYFKRYEQEYFPNGAPIRPDSKPRGPRKKKTT